MKKKYYKVVYNDNNILMSAVVGGKSEVKYYKVKETKPDMKLWSLGYGLCIFNSYRAANMFIRTNAPRSGFCYQIWEIKPGSIIIHNNTLPRPLNLLHLRTGKIIKDRISTSWPVGTLMTNSVLLLKQLK